MAPQDAGALQDLFGVLGDTPSVAIPPERGGGCPKSLGFLATFPQFPQVFFFFGGGRVFPNDLWDTLSSKHGSF